MPGHAIEIWVVRRVTKHKVRVIMQVLADAGELMNYGDTVLTDLFARADTRQLEKLRSLKDTSAEDHLAPRAIHSRLILLAEFHAHRSFAFEDDARGQSVYFHSQVAALARDGVYVGARAAAAFAVLLCDLIQTQSFLFPAVEVVANRIPGLPRSLEVDVHDRIVALQLADTQGSALPVVLVEKLIVIFGSLEVRQHVCVRPPVVAERSPLIVVESVAADVTHGIDGRAASQCLAARLVADSVGESSLRSCIE